MIIEFDKIYNNWVVWNKFDNYSIELYKGSKKMCVEFIKTHKRLKSGKIKAIAKSFNKK